MRRLVYAKAAQRDLADISLYFFKQSGARETGRSFTAGIRAKCVHWAGLSAQVGRERPDFGAGARSVVLGNYIVVLRYAEDRLEVLRIVEGHRDLSRLKPQ